MKKYVSKSAEDTAKLGEQLARTLVPGSVVALTGDLGAGKTVFAKGVAKGLGVARAITSPTFTLLNIYDESKFPLYHFDLYRIESVDEAEAAGLGEYLGARDAVSLVEWHTNVPQLLPDKYIEVEITKTSDTARILIIKEK